MPKPDPAGRAPAGEATPFLSVIIPAYNEERRLAGRLRQAMEYFSAQDYAAEVLVVDDGSTDRTAEIVEGLKREYANLRLLRVVHGGKGHACKQGVFAGRGRWLFLCDSDLAMPPEEFAHFLPLLRDGCDIAIASRELPGARRYGEPRYRHLMGRVFNGLVRLLAVPDIQDTQCGFKCFRADIAQDIFAVQTINGWGFDVELLFVACKRGYHVAEVPVQWYYRSNSKVNPVRDTVNMFREVWQVRLNDRRGIYEKPAQPVDETLY